MPEQMMIPDFSDEVLSSRQCLLLSLKPQAWKLIIEGEKKYEYRRVFRNGPVSAYIYLSSPRKEIAGFINFGQPVIDSPEKIAMFAEKQKSGSFDRMLAYMKGIKKGYAIPILSYEEFKPVSLFVLREMFNFTAPQSYLILDRYPMLKKHIVNQHGANIR